MKQINHKNTVNYMYACMYAHVCMYVRLYVFMHYSKLDCDLHSLLNMTGLDATLFSPTRPPVSTPVTVKEYSAP